MRLTTPKPFPDSAEFFVRRAGYGKIIDREGKVSYVNRLNRTAFYPRFHLYIEKEDEKSMALTLHLDQKQPSYEGTRMHAGEYDGELVEKEVKRIQAAISQMKAENS